MPDAAPPRLLLVEDDADTASLIMETLGDSFGAGCVTRLVNVADVAAIDFTRIDLVLSDMNLPDGSGLDVLAAVLARRADTPVIIVTGEGIIENAVRAIRQGAYDYIVKAGDYLFALPLMVEKNLAIWRTKQENLHLQEQLTRTLEEVRVKNQQLQVAVERLETMAATDPLTGLANRRAFGQAMLRCLSDARRYRHDLSCIMIDLDGFKALNDTLGHQRGDELLVRVARVLEANLRRSDIAGRFGGDEFILILPQADESTARVVAQRINDEFAVVSAALFKDTALTGRVSMSMGLTCLHPDHPADAEQLIAQADNALYRAKQSGRNRLISYTTPLPDPTPKPISTRTA
ncbi:MAG: diguanylate cyclase [Planctomycetes bacterium]|nr:diguanylate cyclase [Planctomycetota bacterium]